jgi:SAM-dependent methyltransferase
MIKATSLDQMQGAYDEHYVLDNTLMLQWYPQRVVQLATGGSLLELGLGHGYSTTYFAQHFSPYRVIEGSPEMIQRFRKRFDINGVDIVEAYFEDFQTSDLYDNIVMGFILEHVNDPALIMRRFRDLLKPKGSVFICVPNSESLHRRIGHAAGLLPDLTQLSQADHDFGHRRYFNLRTLNELVQQERYNVLKVEGIFLKPFTTQQISQLALSPAVHDAMLTVGTDYPELCNAIIMQVQPSG